VLQKAFFGDAEPEAVAADDEEHHPLEPISIPERLGAVILIAVSLVVGLYPRLLMDVIVPSFDSPLFEWLRKGGAQ
jgi:NADH-quinone oxidoreductase subunit M